MNNKLEILQILHILLDAELLHVILEVVLQELLRVIGLLAVLDNFASHVRPIARAPRSSTY